MPGRCDNAGHRGQVLPLFVLALVAILAMAALVIEGGNVLAQQRIAQNGADAAAMAGAIAVAENLAEPGSRDGDDVLAVVSTATQQTEASSGDDLSDVVATYTDGFGVPIEPVASGPIPAAARGVNVGGTRQADTTIARVIGINQLPASADATAVAGVLVGPCPPDETCAVLPITMPVSYSDTICDEDLDSLGPGVVSPQVAWTLISSVSDATSANMSVLPLCITGSGDFSWLDLGPDNLQQEILNPSGMDFLIPDWLQTQPGNPNSTEDEINTYVNQTVLIPMWQGICDEDPGGIDDPCLGDPEGNGNNTWYAIPYMRPFLLDRAYIEGDNRSDCEVPGVTWPEETKVQGLIGCLKGWWLDTTVIGGPVDPNRPITGDEVIGVQLIK